MDAVSNDAVINDPQSVNNATSLEDARKELDELIGLESVKERDQ